MGLLYLRTASYPGGFADPCSCQMHAPSRGVVLPKLSSVAGRRRRPSDLGALKIIVCASETQFASGSTGGRRKRYLVETLTEFLTAWFRYHLGQSKKRD
ncbi:hypothetical protein TNIN_433241 [Trichonephila inaurata madagascariensis]|uniref:Uncharacterized protein n=1 Tax=Trichonephila inaurata madagascariensis TaxID=2747483 RepID=A0A8X6WRB6_9ARAC|nr:hypothetical protein TNIN_433241 [Trichonephila inaurata madagascariensis]